MMERQLGLVADPKEQGGRGPWIPVPVKWQQVSRIKWTLIGYQIVRTIHLTHYCGQKAPVSHLMSAILDSRDKNDDH